MQYSLYYTILHYTTLYYTILRYTILYYVILYYTTLYYTILAGITTYQNHKQHTDNEADNKSFDSTAHRQISGTVDLVE